MNIFDILLAGKLGSGGGSGANIFTPIINIGEKLTCDKTWQEILGALMQGQIIIFKEYDANEPTGRLLTISSMGGSGGVNWITASSLYSNTSATGAIGNAGVITYTITDSGAVYDDSIQITT